MKYGDYFGMAGTRQMATLRQEVVQNRQSRRERTIGPKIYQRHRWCAEHFLGMCSMMNTQSPNENVLDTGCVYLQTHLHLFTQKELAVM